MRKLIPFECLKLFTNKRFRAILLLVLLLDLAILLYGQYQAKQGGVTYSAYKKLNQELKERNQIEKGEYIKKAYERAYAFSLIQSIQSMSNSSDERMQEFSAGLRRENEELYTAYLEEYHAGAKIYYTKDIESELHFWEEIKQQYDQTADYKKKIEEIQDKAVNLEQISIFRESVDDFSRKNIKDTAKQYQNMKSISIDYQVSKGMDCLTQFSAADFFILLLVLVMASILIFDERENGLLTLIRSTKNGRAKTIVAKMVVICIAVGLLTFVLYLIHFIYYGTQIGYGNLGASLQSIHTFLYSTLQLKVGQYLLIFLLTKVLVYILIAFLALLFSSWAKSPVMAYFCTILCLAVSWVFYTKIDANASNQILKYCNLCQWMEVNGIYKTYLNLKIGVRMQNLLTLTILCGMLFMIGIVVALVWSFPHITGCRGGRLGVLKSTVSGWFEQIRAKRTSIFHLRPVNTLFAHEFYKLWIVNQVLWLLILFSAFQIYQYHHSNQTLSYSEHIYRNYMEFLEGNLTTEKETFIQKEKQRFEQAQRCLEEIDEKVRLGEIDREEALHSQAPYEEILSGQEIFAKVLERYTYIKEHPKAEFVYDGGYQKLLRIGKNSLLESDITLMLMAILSFTSIFVMEYRTDMVRLLRGMPKGRKATAKSKIFICFFTSGIIFAISIIPEILMVQKQYGLRRLTASIISLRPFAKLPDGIHILAYVIGMYMIRYLIFAAIVLMILWISLKMKHTIYAMFVTIGIFLLPVALELLGLDFARNISVIPMLNITRVILAGGGWRYLYVVLPLLLGVVSYQKLCRSFGDV